MACVFESSDNGLIAKPHEGTTNWNSQELVNELNRVQTMLPQLSTDGLAAARTLLQEQKLLPDFEIVASRDADGRVRDENGRIVQLTASEMTGVIQQDMTKVQEQIKAPFSDGQFAFERFSKGNQIVDPANLLDQARISQSDIEGALQMPNLSEKERAGLNFLKDNYQRLKAADPYYSNDSLSASSISGLEAQTLAAAPGDAKIGPYSTIRPDVIFDSAKGYTIPHESTQEFYDSIGFWVRKDGRYEVNTEVEKELVVATKNLNENEKAGGRYSLDDVNNADIFSLIQYEDGSECRLTGQ